MTDRLSLRQTIALTAAGSALLTAGAIIGGQALRRSVRTEKLKESITDELNLSDEPWTSDEALKGMDTLSVDGGAIKRDAQHREWEAGQFDEDLIREQVCEMQQLRTPRVYVSTFGIL
jgi:hypothetical protein